MPLPRSFYFLRHGETDWNREKRMQGWTDIPLNDKGRAQARDAVAVLKTLPLARIVTSSLARAHETARIVNEVLRLPLVDDARLRERGYGVLEGLDADKADAVRAERMRTPGLALEETGYPCPEGAEPYAVLKARVVESVTEHLADKEDGVLFVSHGGVYRVLCRLLTGAPDHSPNARPIFFQKTEAGWRIERVDSRHRAHR